MSSQHIQPSSIHPGTKYLPEGLNHNIGNANQLECVAILRAAFKTKRFAPETQEKKSENHTANQKQNQLKAEDRAALRNPKKDQTITLLPAEQ